MASYNQTRFMEDLLERNKSQPPSFTVHLHSDHFNLNNSGKLSYTHPTACIFADIRAHRIPTDFLDIFNSAQLPFYDGCMIVELLDHRSEDKKEPILERIVLQPNGESLYADICLMNAKYGSKWTDLDALEVEARILLATAPPLCLDPDPHLSRIANQILRVSTPNIPASLKRKAEVAEPEESKIDKAKKAKILQFWHPRLDRSHTPSYRILEAIKRKEQGIHSALPEPTPAPAQASPANQPAPQIIPPSRAPSQTPAPQSAGPAQHPVPRSTQPSPAPTNAPTPYNQPHSPTPSQIPITGSVEDVNKRLQQTTTPQTFAIPIHSNPSAPSQVAPAVRVNGGTPVPVPVPVIYAPTGAQHYQHLLQQNRVRSASPTKQQAMHQHSPSPTPSAAPQQPQIQTSAQAHMYPSVQAATAAAANQALPSTNPPPNAANGLSPADAAMLMARRATTPAAGSGSVTTSQAQRLPSPRVVPIGIQNQASQKTPVQNQVPATVRSATPTQQQNPIQASQAQASLPQSQPQNPTQTSVTPAPSSGFQPPIPGQNFLNAPPNPRNAPGQPPTTVQSAGNPQAQQPTMINSGNANGTQVNPTMNQAMQQHQLYILQQQQQKYQQVARMKLLQQQPQQTQQQRAGTPSNQGIVRPGQSPHLVQQQLQVPQQQQHPGQQHASPRPSSSQPVPMNTNILNQQGTNVAAATPIPGQTALPNPGAIPPAGIGRGSPMMMQAQRVMSNSPMPGAVQHMSASSNLNPNAGVNSPRVVPQQAGLPNPGVSTNPYVQNHSAPLIARMRQQGMPAAAGPPATGAGGDGQGTPQRPQSQQAQMSAGMQQQLTQNMVQNQMQQGMGQQQQQQQQQAYPVYYGQMVQGRLPPQYYQMMSQQGMNHQNMGNMPQNAQGMMFTQQYQQFLMQAGRGRGGFVMQQQQPQPQGRGGGMPGR
ncbi:saga complex subunit spt20 [Moniliophthora roreri]|uniref:Spt20-like SEP domain-containing protein n=1 Tax=Moniliophthora roreri TaxID=221103 RepID=A0A0W0GA29_MONRR|nr:saga complex subunit spt20 [Moniliophthora roreri]